MEFVQVSDVSVDVPNLEIHNSLRRFTYTRFSQEEKVWRLMENATAIIEQYLARASYR